MPLPFDTVDIANNLPVQPIHVLQIIQSLTQFGQTYSTVDFYRQGRTSFGANSFQSEAHVELSSYAGRNPLTVYGGVTNNVTALEVDIDGDTYISNLTSDNLSGSALQVNGPTTLLLGTDNLEVSTTYGPTGMFTVDTATVRLGDYANSNFGTKIEIDDQAETVRIKADGGIFVTGSLFATLTGSVTFATSASRAVSAATASYVVNAITASFLPIGTYNITSSQAVSSSYALTASRAVTASFLDNLSSIVVPYIVSGSITAAVNTGSAVFQIRSGSTVPLTVQPSKIGINTTALPSGALHIRTGSTNYFNFNGADSHIVLENPSVNGQSVISSVINGNVTGKIRNDYVGNMNYATSGSTSGHYFFMAGDYLSPSWSIGLAILGTTPNNSTVGINNQTPSYNLDVSGSANVTNRLTVTGSISILSASLSGSVVTNVGDSYTSYASVQNLVTLTSAEYAAITTPVSGTLYIVL